MDTNTTQLPPYRALLIVDVKDFSGLPGRDHAELTDAIPGLLKQAFNRCGLSHLWSELRFQSTTGDGYVLGFPAEHLPFLLSPFLPSLQEELDYRDTVRSVSGVPQALRMRVSVNVGPMTDSGGRELSEGSGDARIENHRLLDSAPVRDLLSRSGPVTRVAAIVSARAFEDAVLSGFTDDHTDFYVEVPVEVKTYRAHAYLRVPKPSGDLLKSGFLPPQALPPKHPRTSPAEGQPGGVGAIHGDVGNIIHGGTGPIHANNSFGSRRRRDDER